MHSCVRFTIVHLHLTRKNCFKYLNEWLWIRIHTYLTTAIGEVYLPKPTNCRMNIPTKIWLMNPKDRSVIELYGILDPNTRDWTDGLLSSIFRLINKPTDRNERKYILFDGDVDALWVENMNSVMDDNKLLTLANGERIRLQKHCALLFEVINEYISGVLRY